MFTTDPPLSKERGGFFFMQPIADVEFENGCRVEARPASGSPEDRTPNRLLRLEK